MSDFPRYRLSPEPVLLSTIADWVKGSTKGSGNPTITRVTPLLSAGPSEMGLLASRRYLADLTGSKAEAILVSADIADALPPEAPPALVVPDAHQALAVILERFHPLEPVSEGIHDSAIVAPSARIGRGVRIGPFAVIEEEAIIGDTVTIGSHVMVGAGVRIGEDSRIFPHVVLYPGTHLGKRVRIHSGARIGVDGFGYVFRDGGHRRVPQVGRCVLDDDVEIGANTTVDRGSIGDTRIGRGVKIDNLVQIGHNVTIGPHSIVVSQAGIAGSTHVGTGVLIGGQVGVAGHLTIGDGARLSARAGVTGDVEADATVSGFPARPRMEFLRAVAAQRNTTELLRRVRALERANEG